MPVQVYKNLLEILLRIALNNSFWKIKKLEPNKMKMKQSVIISPKIK